MTSQATQQFSTQDQEVIYRLKSTLRKFKWYRNISLIMLLSALLGSAYVLYYYFVRRAVFTTIAGTVAAIVFSALVSYALCVVCSYSLGDGIALFEGSVQKTATALKSLESGQRTQEDSGC